MKSLHKDAFENCLFFNEVNLYIVTCIDLKSIIHWDNFITVIILYNLYTVKFTFTGYKVVCFDM